MTGSTHGQISAAFQDEGFARIRTPPGTTAARRTATPHYLEAVNWTDPSHVTRALRAMTRLMDEFDEQYSEAVRKALRRDGCQIDGHGQIIIANTNSPRSPSVASATLPQSSTTSTASSVRSATTQPKPSAALKELIESTAKTVLLERGQTVNEKDTIADKSPRPSSPSICIPPPPPLAPTAAMRSGRSSARS